ncbi:YhfG family protein [Pantoea cypripedii]|uniref:YhfG family protein n=1 Tax=Pantoea cypripedii TaxID=55209 RepID=UPI001301FCDB|nr:YhfG family protein [Pantoea cypripedii]MBP2196401.1 hypothetical protein [Pantoea cypripedii]
MRKAQKNRTGKRQEIIYEQTKYNNFIASSALEGIDIPRELAFTSLDQVRKHFRQK